MIRVIGTSVAMRAEPNSNLPTLLRKNIKSETRQMETTTRKMLFTPFAVWIEKKY
jgi:hypothetical protein